MRGVLIGALLVCLATTAQALSDKEAKAIYAADRQKVLSGDLIFDWQQFRLAAKQGGAEPFDWQTARAQFVQKMDAGDSASALSEADKIIAHNMADPEGHLLAMMALRQLGKFDDAAFQRRIVEAWVGSLQRSGDGKASGTAFVVMDETEEYFYLNVVLGIGLPESQALVQREGHSFDVLKVKTREGKQEDVWFNVDVSMNELRDSLAHDH